VRVEKEEVEREKDELTARQNMFKIQLEELEANLLKNLSDADMATILENLPLIESLELTKKTSNEIKQQQAMAVIKEADINRLREVYRLVAAEGAMLYFLLI